MESLETVTKPERKISALQLSFKMHKTRRSNGGKKNERMMEREVSPQAKKIGVHKRSQG